MHIGMAFGNCYSLVDEIDVISEGTDDYSPEELAGWYVYHALSGTLQDADVSVIEEQVRSEMLVLLDRGAVIDLTEAVEYAMDWFSYR